MSHVMGQNSLTSWGKNNLNFWLICDHVLHLQTAANLCVSQLEANYFFTVCFIFELGGITKCLVTGPKGNS